VSLPPRCPSPAPRTAARALAAALLAAGTLALAACEGGAIGQNTPASNGQSFVGGTGGETVFGPGKGPAAPPVTGPAVGGGQLSLAQFSGHVVVMNFWGSWCTPCRAEAPALAAAARRYQPSGVRFLGVDIRDSTVSAQAFRRDFHIGYPSLNDPADQVALDFRSTVPPAGIPTTLVIGRDGRITARVVGEVTGTGLRTLITRALAQPS
jgi:thiol-disulfide isomerase/thioredoxin